MQKLFKPVDPATIGLFRICFGLIIFVHSVIQSQYIYPKFIGSEFFFSFPYLSFMKPWPGDGMFIHYAVMIAATVGITLGYFYRQSLFIFFITYLYTFLIDISYYKNHHYLILLVAFLMFFINADARYALTKTKKTVYFWNIWILRAQFCLVYFFAGIAKLNYDWLHGEPIRFLLAKRSLQIGEHSFWGNLLQETWVHEFITYGGLAFDLIILFLLINKKTRKFAALLAIAFNSTNLFVFPVVVAFSLLMLASLIIFFEPDWPEKLMRTQSPNTKIDTPDPPKFQAATVNFLFIYVLIQICLPLRHFLYSGNVLWTSQGERFAWRMILKRERGVVDFKIIDSQFRQEWIPRTTKRPINRRQYQTMLTRPELILQYAHYWRDQALKNGIDQPSVFADSWHSINGRAMQQMIKPDADLSKVKLSDNFLTWNYVFRQ